MMFMYFEPLTTTKKAIATCHVMLFGCRMGEGDFTLTSTLLAKLSVK